MAPRLLVGSVAGSSHTANLLERAGHSVVRIDPDGDPGAIQHVDLVLVEGDVEASVDKLAPYARPRQMFLHTELAHGAQLLDAVEVRQAIVMCAHNLFGVVWVTAAADELGETVVGLLVAEMGGMSFPVQDAQRPALVAAQHLRGLEMAVRQDAFSLLSAEIPALEAVRGDYLEAPAAPLPPMSAAELSYVAGAIVDPGVRRLFVDLTRRNAERTGDTAAELWAYSKYEGTI